MGITGGGCGAHASCVLNPGRADERDIGRIDVLELGRGDTLRMITPSGGGYGDPFERDPARVLDEVLDGLLTPEQGRRIYGVVVADGAAIAKLRRSREPESCEFQSRPDPRRGRSHLATRHQRGIGKCGDGRAGRGAHPLGSGRPC